VCIPPRNYQFLSIEIIVSDGCLEPTHDLSQCSVDFETQKTDNLKYGVDAGAYRITQKCYIVHIKLILVATVAIQFYNGPVNLFCIQLWPIAIDDVYKLCLTICINERRIR
jgi:hypothetical protein